MQEEPVTQWRAPRTVLHVDFPRTNHVDAILHILREDALQRSLQVAIRLDQEIYSKSSIE
jgi:hypothetical protein